MPKNRKSRFQYNFELFPFSPEITTTIMKLKQLKNPLLFAGAMVMASVMITACMNTKNDHEQVVMSDQDYILRGKYLVTVGGCNDCHTPKKFTEQGMSLDESRLLSGHPLNDPLPPLDEKALIPGNWVLFNAHNTVALGPWGMSWAKNLTPHETGMKNWEEEVFIKAMQTGKHMGVDAGRPIMPPMPWMNLSSAPAEDLKAIYKYLQSIPPVDNRVPDPISPDEVRELINSQTES